MFDITKATFTKEITIILIYLSVAAGLYFFPTQPFEHDAMYYIREDKTSHKILESISTTSRRISSSISIIEATIDKGILEHEYETEYFICHKDKDGIVFIERLFDYDLSTINEEISKKGSLSEKTIDEIVSSGQEIQFSLSERKKPFVIPTVFLLGICIVLLVASRLIYLKYLNNDDTSKMNETQKLIYSYCVHFSDIFRTILILVLIFAWFIIFFGRNYDLFFLFVPPFICECIRVYFVDREDKKYKVKADQDDNEELTSIHRSYNIQRKGVKSRNPVIFILDFLYQRYPGKEKETIIGYYGVYFILSTVLVGIFSLIFDTNYTMVTIVYLSSLVLFLILSIFKFGDLYRHLRHKYIKDNNLPGPYGWGTIDYNHSSTYIKREDDYYGGSSFVSGHYRRGHMRNGHWVSGSYVRSHFRR